MAVIGPSSIGSVGKQAEKSKESPKDNKNPFKWVIISGVAAFVLVAGAAAAYFYIYPRIKRDKVLEEMEAEDVFRKVVEKEGSLAGIFDSVFGGGYAVLSNPVNLDETQYLGEYNCKAVTIKLESGDPEVYGACNTLTNLDKNGQLSSGSIETYSYLDKDTGIKYTKRVGKSQDDQLLSYSLVTDEDEYTYAGGEYAVRDERAYFIEDNEERKCEVEEAEEIDDDELESLFGEDFELVDYRTEGLKSYYILQMEDKTVCDLASMGEDSQTRDTFYELWIEDGSYKLAKVVIYLDEVSEDQMVLAMNFSDCERRDVDFDDVEEIFEFEYDVDVQEEGEAGELPSREDILESYELMTKKEDFVLLKPTRESVSLSSFTPAGAYAKYSEVALSEYVYDRDFYPDGDLGDQLYEEMTAALNDSWAGFSMYTKLYTASYTDSSGTDEGLLDGYSIEVHEGTEKTDESIVFEILYSDSFDFGEFEKNKQVIKTKLVSGEAVEASVYTQSGAASSTTVMIFELDGDTFVITKSYFDAYKSKKEFLSQFEALYSDEGDEDEIVDMFEDIETLSDSLLMD